MKEFGAVSRFIGGVYLNRSMSRMFRHIFSLFRFYPKFSLLLIFMLFHLLVLFIFVKDGSIAFIKLTFIVVCFSGYLHRNFLVVIIYNLFILLIYTRILLKKFSKIIFFIKYIILRVVINFESHIYGFDLVLIQLL